MQNRKIHPGTFSGKIAIPASKSDTQRALLAAALAPGNSTLFGVGFSEDEQSMMESIQQLGARVRPNDDGSFTILGGLDQVDGQVINAGESGLGSRLLTGICATFSVETTIKAEGSLKHRPMDFFERYLPQLNVQVTTDSGRLPITVKGPMQGGKITVDGSLSSQFISALLMALPQANSDSSLVVESLNSRPYVDMTLATLREFGIRIDEHLKDQFFIPGNQVYTSTNYHIEADWSAAAFWLVAAALGANLSLTGLKAASLQADRALLTFLEQAGCSIHQDSGAYRVDGSKLQAFHVDATHCPDLFPALVVLAAGIEGISTIRGTNRLEHKESNRGWVLKEEFGKLGLHMEINGDLMTIHGTGKLKGGILVDAHFDHRIAMALGIACLLIEEPIKLHGHEAVSKSYPFFWEHFDTVFS